MEWSRRPFAQVALLFGDGRLAVAAGGGDTDEALGLVHEEAVTFPQVCEALKRRLGPAAVRPTIFANPTTLSPLWSWACSERTGIATWRRCDPG
jgi:hypothetical protein